MTGGRENYTPGSITLEFARARRKTEEETMAGNGKLSLSALTRLARFVNAFWEKHSRCPSTFEIIAGTKCANHTPSRMWRPMLDAKLISAEMYASRFALHRGARLRTGDCSPETAYRIWELLRKDESARASFALMMRGHLCRDGVRNFGVLRS